MLKQFSFSWDPMDPMVVRMVTEVISATQTELVFQHLCGNGDIVKGN